MDDFSRPDRCQVAVTLVGKDDFVGIGAGDTRRYCRRPAMGRFLPVNVDQVIGEYGTPHR